jgi:hypothetical protein
VRILHRRSIVAGAVLLAYVAFWLALGQARSADLARSYFLGVHPPENGYVVTELEVTSAAPGIPPFWWVSIDGQVAESGAAGAAYTSALILWIEPLSGSVFVFALG